MGARLRNNPYMVRRTDASPNSAMRPGRACRFCSAILITASPTDSNIVATFTNPKILMIGMLSWGVGVDNPFRLEMASAQDARTIQKRSPWRVRFYLQDKQ